MKAEGTRGNKRETRWNQREPEGTRWNQGEPGGIKREPEGTRVIKREPRGTRWSQGEPDGTRGDQREPDGTSEGTKIHEGAAHGTDPRSTSRSLAQWKEPIPCFLTQGNHKANAVRIKKYILMLAGILSTSPHLASTYPLPSKPITSISLLNWTS